MKQLRLARTLDLGDDGIALVWDAGGGVTAYVSDADLAQAMPDHVLQALAMFLSLDDPEIVGRMWEKLEARMDADMAGHAEDYVKSQVEVAEPGEAPDDDSPAD